MYYDEKYAGYNIKDYKITKQELAPQHFDVYFMYDGKEQLISFFITDPPEKIISYSGDFITFCKENRVIPREEDMIILSTTDLEDKQEALKEHKALLFYLFDKEITEHPEQLITLNKFFFQDCLQTSAFDEVMDYINNNKFDEVMDYIHNNEFDEVRNES